MKAYFKNIWKWVSTVALGLWSSFVIEMMLWIDEQKKNTSIKLFEKTNKKMEQNKIVLLRFLLYWNFFCIENAQG